MKIGIIGAGNIGGTLARRLAALGHEVSVANSRGPKSLAGLAAESGATAVSVSEAARRGQVVIVTIPRRTFPACRPACSPGCPTTWSSSIPATTARSSATAGSRRSRPA